MQQQFVLWLARIIALRIIKWNGNRFNYIRAIKKAEELTVTKLINGNERKGKRHYVYFTGSKYRIWNRKDVQNLRNTNKSVRSDLKVSKMKPIQCYDTQGHINSHITYTDIEIKGINIQYVRPKDLVAEDKKNK